MTGGLVAFALSDRTSLAAMGIALAFGGAALGGLLVPGRPVVAFGLLFALASVTLAAIQLPVGNLRLEQPAILGVLAAIAVSAGHIRYPSLRPLVPLLVAAGIHLGVLALSSALFAPIAGVSLRLVTWTALSMVAGVAAYLLTSRTGWGAGGWVVAPAGALALSGLVIATVFSLTIPPVPGMQGELMSRPRVTSWAREANLYASFIAAAVPIAIERSRDRPGLARAAVAVLILVGLALGVTRGAWLGLAAGLAVYGAILLVRRVDRRSLGLAGGVLVLGLGVGWALTATLLDPEARDRRLEAASPGSSALLVASDDPERTLEHRLRRIGLALEDWRTSPLIGLGAESFGQRHGDPTKGGAPDHIAIMAVAVLHDSGVIGLAGLGLLGALAAHALWRASAHPTRAGPAAAYAAALVVLVVSYQATNALHFALNWLLLGAAMGIAYPAVGPTISDASTTGHQAPGLPRGAWWRLTSRLSERSRRLRMARFMTEIRPSPETTVLDVGVTDVRWRSGNFLESAYPWPERITAVSPVPLPTFERDFPDVRLVIADGRSLPFGDGEFEVGFSNAVVEHVGSRDDQRRFVAEVLRTCRRVFICTPDRRFPVDPHTLLPFVHWLPLRLRAPILRATGNGRWATEEGLNPLDAGAFVSLFPPVNRPRLFRQRLFGLSSVLIVLAQGTTPTATKAGDAAARQPPSAAW